MSQVAKYHTLPFLFKTTATANLVKVQISWAGLGVEEYAAVNPALMGNLQVEALLCSWYDGDCGTGDGLELHE